MLQKVVCHYDGRHLGKNCSSHGLAANPLLELIKQQRAITLPGENLAINNRAFWQDVIDRRDLGITLGDQLFTTRPEESLPTAPDELTANSISFPFGLPLRSVAEGLEGLIKCMGQEKGIGLA